MLLGAAKILKEIEDKLHGTVKLIFQPGEEKVPGGASIMIKEGVLENPAPQAIFGQHVNALESNGIVSIAPGPIMASADELYWTIRGKSGHAAQPHLSSDTVLASAQLIIFVQSLMTKFRDPLTPGVISVTAVHGGSAPNIFPEEVKLMGTLRSFNKEWRDEMHVILESKSKEICALYNADCELNIAKGYSPVINNESTTTIARQAAIDIFGEDKIITLEPKMWAEDFGYYSMAIPGTFWFLGVRPEGMKEMAPLHNPKFAPDESAMIKGAALMAYAAVKFLAGNI
jgi:hippurate hydrolase